MVAPNPTASMGGGLQESVTRRWRGGRGWRPITCTPWRVSWNHPWGTASSGSRPNSPTPPTTIPPKLINSSSDQSTPTYPACLYAYVCRPDGSLARRPNLAYFNSIFPSSYRSSCRTYYTWVHSHLHPIILQAARPGGVSFSFPILSLVSLLYGRSISSISDLYRCMIM